MDPIHAHHAKPAPAQPAAERPIPDWITLRVAPALVVALLTFLLAPHVTHRSFWTDMSTLAERPYVLAVLVAILAALLFPHLIRRAFWTSCSSFLTNNFILAVFGAVGTILVAPYLTERWQNHQKELDTKSSLISTISQSTTRMVVAVQLVQQFGFKGLETKNDLTQDYKDWAINSGDISARLNAYFPHRSVAAHWQQYVGMVNFLYESIDCYDPTQKRTLYSERVAMFESMRAYFSHGKSGSINWKLLEQHCVRPPIGTNIDYQQSWFALRADVLNGKNAINQEVLDTPMST